MRLKADVQKNKNQSGSEMIIPTRAAEEKRVIKI